MSRAKQGLISTTKKGNEHIDSTFLEASYIDDLGVAETTNGSTRIILRLPPPLVPIKTCPFWLLEPKLLLYSTT
jgi:hypothetical protein